MAMAKRNPRLFFKKNRYLFDTLLALLAGMAKTNPMRVAEYLCDFPRFFGLLFSLYDDETSLCDDKDFDKTYGDACSTILAAVMDPKVEPYVLFAARYDEELHTLLKQIHKVENEVALPFYTDDLPEVKRSLFMPSARRRSWVYDFFYGGGFGTMLGGAIGAIVGSVVPGIGTAVGTAFGVAIGGGVGTVYGLAYPKLAKMWRYHLFQIHSRWHVNNSDQEPPDRPRYETVKAKLRDDTPLHELAIYGMFAGILIGGSFGILVSIGPVIAAAAAALIFGALALLSPVAQHLSDKLFLYCRSRLLPSDIPRWFSATKISAPGRFLAGVLAGSALGGAIGGYVGLLGGSFVLPFFGPIAGATMLSALGALFGAAIVGIAALLSPYFLAPVKRLASDLFPRSPFLSDDQQSSSNYPWYVTLALGASAGVATGTALGMVAPVVGPIVGAFAGVVAGTALAGFSIVLGGWSSNFMRSCWEKCWGSTSDDSSNNEKLFNPSKVEPSFLERWTAGVFAGKLLGGAVGITGGLLAGLGFFGGLIAPIPGGAFVGMAMGGLFGAAGGALAGSVFASIESPLKRAYYKFKSWCGSSKKDDASLDSDQESSDSSLEPLLIPGNSSISDRRSSEVNPTPTPKLKFWLDVGGGKKAANDQIESRRDLSLESTESESFDDQKEQVLSIQ